MYHGSREGDLEEIEAATPSYKGSLGHGVYVSESEEVAAFYGPFVYKLLLKLKEDQIYTISPESDTTFFIPELEGTSVLVGEELAPFAFRIPDHNGVRGETYSITGDDDPTTQIGVERFKKAIEGTQYEILFPKLDRMWQLPDTEYDDVLALIEEGFEYEVGRPPDRVDMAALEASGLIGRIWRDLVEIVRASTPTDLGMGADLEEIGRLVEHHGYRAVRMEGMRMGGAESEILVFNERDLVLLSMEKVERRR